MAADFTPTTIVDGRYAVVPTLPTIAVSKDGEVVSAVQVYDRPVGWPRAKWRNERGVWVCSAFRRYKQNTGGGLIAVGRAMLLAWVGPPPMGENGKPLTARFVDGDPDNLVLENLRWGTARTTPTVLTPELVENMLYDHVCGDSGRLISKRYGVAPSTVKHVLARRTWAHIPLPVVAPGPDARTPEAAE